MVFIVVPLPFRYELNIFCFAKLLKNYSLFVPKFS